MGFLFQCGRIGLGILIIMAGLMIVQGGYKDHI